MDGSGEKLIRHYGDDMKCTDITIAVMNESGESAREYRLHKFFLCSHSSYFAGMFENGTKEANMNIVEVKLRHACLLSLFPHVLLWLYDKELDTNVINLNKNTTDFVHLLHLGSYLGIKSLTHELLNIYEKDALSFFLPMAKVCSDYGYSDIALDILERTSDIGFYIQNNSMPQTILSPASKRLQRIAAKSAPRGAGSFKFGELEDELLLDDITDTSTPVNSLLLIFDQLAPREALSVTFSFLFLLRDMDSIILAFMDILAPIIDLFWFHDVPEIWLMTTRCFIYLITKVPVGTLHPDTLAEIILIFISKKNVDSGIGIKIIELIDIRALSDSYMKHRFLPFCKHFFKQQRVAVDNLIDQFLPRKSFTLNNHICPVTLKYLQRVSDFSTSIGDCYMGRHYLRMIRTCGHIYMTESLVYDDSEYEWTDNEDTSCPVFGCKGERKDQNAVSKNQIFEFFSERNLNHAKRSREVWDWAQASITAVPKLLEEENLEDSSLMTMMESRASCEVPVTAHGGKKRKTSELQSVEVSASSAMLIRFKVVYIGYVKPCEPVWYFCENDRLSVPIKKLETLGDIVSLWCRHHYLHRHNFAVLEPKHFLESGIQMSIKHISDPNILSIQSYMELYFSSDLVSTNGTENYYYCPIFISPKMLPVRSKIKDSVCVSSDEENVYDSYY